MLSILRSWQQDRLLRGVFKNSGYLFSSNTIAAGLGMLQGIFAARLIGVDGYGLVGTILVFASNVNRLLSFRMSEAVVRYLGQYLVDEDKERAGAAAKGAALLEASTSVLAYLVLLALTPLAARFLAKDPQTLPMFAFYGLVLIGNLIYETSTGVLQSTKRFGWLAMVNLVQSVITAALIFAAFVAHWNIWAILTAYLAGKSAAGILIAIFAFRSLDQTLGRGWWKAPLGLITEWKEMLRFALSTNFNGTVNLVVRDSEILFVAGLCSTTQAGYFRLAYGLINLVMMPIDPFVGPTYAEITRTIVQRQWQVTRQLLKRVSLISAAWTLSAGLGLMLFGRWLIPFMYGQGTEPTYPAVLLLLVGYGFANIFQWNRPLLLALGMPGYPLKVSAATGVIKTVLTVTLVPAFGYLAEAAILSAYFLSSIGWILGRGIREMDKRIRIAQESLDYSR